MEKYKPNDIYNADETGLFWQMLPENSLGFIGKKAHGSKQPKKCITLLVGANMSGTDKLPLLAIGKSKEPKAFKNVRKLLVDSETNIKAWMRSDLFEQYLHKLDRKIKSDGRKIVMVLDNYQAHPHVKLENVELAFLPPNTTSRTQPMDAGVIRNFKLHYRCILASRRLQAAENGHEDFKWSLLDCLLAVKSAWSLVKATTIANSYRNAGFVFGDAPSRAESSAQVESNPESELRTFTNVWDVLNCTIGERPSLQDYIDVDNQVDCTERMTDQEIVAEVLNDRLNPESDDNDQLSETPIYEPEPIPTTTQAIQSIDCIRRFTLSMDDYTSITEDTLRLTTILEQKLMQEKALRSKQTMIT